MKMKNIRYILSALVSAFNSSIQRFLSMFLSQRMRACLCAVDVIQRYDAVMKQISNISSSKISILDVGGGGGTMSEFIEPAKHYLIVLDIQMEDVKNASTKGLHSICGDGTYLPFKDSSFDVVTSVSSLEHIPKQQRVPYLNEL